MTKVLKRAVVSERPISGEIGHYHGDVSCLRAGLDDLSARSDRHSTQLFGTCIRAGHAVHHVAARLPKHSATPAGVHHEKKQLFFSA
jgi:hypothetical protein